MAPSRRSSLRYLGALSVACAATALFGACARPAPSSPAAPTTDASASAARGSASAAPACGGLSACASCAAVEGCRWCTDPHACIGPGGTCNGLALLHPSTCANDPALGGNPRKDAIAASRDSYLHEIPDLAPAGPAIEARLESLTSLSLPVEAGRCFTVIWSVSDDAKLREVMVQFDFVTSKGVGTGVIALTHAGWSGRACSSLAGTLRATILDPETYAPFAAAGTGKISFVLYARARTATDPDDATARASARPASSTSRPTATASPSSTAAPSNPLPPRGGSVGYDCQDCTFPCESSQRDCERRCFVDERDDAARRNCDRVCEQIGRSCLRGCGGCI